MLRVQGKFYIYKYYFIISPIQVQQLCQFKVYYFIYFYKALIKSCLM
jgi:hypothetical protein